MQLYSYTMHFANRLPFSSKIQWVPRPPPQISQFVLGGGGGKNIFFVPPNFAPIFRQCYKHKLC